MIRYAQVAYDNFFDLPVPPPAPVVTVAELNNQIVLDWSKDNARVKLTEDSDSKGYKFQGYNVYQLPTASSSPSEGVRIATYDIIDGVGKIYDLTFDPTNWICSFTSCSIWKRCRNKEIYLNY